MRWCGLLMLLVGLTAGCAALRAEGDDAKAEDAPSDGAAVRMHNGRPMVFVDGEPQPLPAYSPTPRPGLFRKQTRRFFGHGLGAYFIHIPRGKPREDEGWRRNPFWVGDKIEPQYLRELATPGLGEQAGFILDGDPDAHLIVRGGGHEPASWRHKHRDQLVVNEEGERLPVPSLASDAYWRAFAEQVRAQVTYCESRGWSDRIIGYWPGMRTEGTHEALMDGWLFDHSEPMRKAWRRFLRQRYRTKAALRQAYGDPTLSFDDPPPIPEDRLRGPVRRVSSLLYWQPASTNRPLRDYLRLQQRLFHRGFRKVAKAAEEAAGQKRVFLWDALKQHMLGWDNRSFFGADTSKPLRHHGMMAGSGHISVTDLFDAEGFDGLITPHTYQARGPGGVYQPEAIVDTALLRGKVYFTEMDTRTDTGAAWSKYYKADNDKQFRAITWRNIADTLTRGYYSYYMDLYTDWFASDAIHETIGRQVEVLNRSVEWEHETPSGIAMILDDTAVLETNGDGRYFNRAIMWEQKRGIARCGVPYRIYMLDDLKREGFPDHEVFYFPNLFRVTDERLKLLKERVFRDGNVVLWGPGSGISDGRTLGPEHAEKLTRFTFDYLPVNYPHRVQVHDYQHPITRGMDEGRIFGGPLSYGPLLLPKDGRRLGVAWTKQGRNAGGLAVKQFGSGAAGVGEADSYGRGDWASVFTHAVPIPANMWRGLARFAGAHVYTDSNDVLMASRRIVGLHSIRNGRKTIRLREPAKVVDLIEGETVAQRTEKIAFKMDTPATRLFRLIPAED